ncbi:putative pre-16S rRNA nuclease [Sulfurimicrobium lacus]|uniref:Putative pre-16S rRNA nuclease n=2 Tax=Sulfurimicrobium lacus TaxID=2715678 RepID=A0A6F8V8C1_9PROT|nr:putative pre-16S rRNA nuclease [Sulfurimicrobium lacus]
MMATSTPHPSPLTPHRTTVLCFDFGLQRIGVAVGDVTIGVAHPLETIHGESNEQKFGAIAILIQEWQPGALVVGLPLHLDGTEHEMTLRCRKFSRQLEGRFNLPVALVDERLTSEAASQDLRAMGIGGRRQKAMLDQVAAQLILQTYLDENKI